MLEKYVLTEHISNYNNVIRQSLQLTQRIKFTCFDVSNKYMVFGATSGGIYVFARLPCVFIKLIPNKEGAIIIVSISPNEKHIAAATTKGLVLLLQNCFEEREANHQQFIEHEGNTITAMKWQHNDVYSGDDRGKISVVTIANLLTKAIFQTPAASLMKLDSQIVQIDTYSKFLLISTQTKSYLANTDKEYFRQIGKKLRDGPFGACFLGKQNPENPEAKLTSVINFFQSTSEASDETPIDVKIFCARPGARLWQVDFDAAVNCTHQFKQSLNQKPISIIHVDENPDSHLNITNCSSESQEQFSESFNFGKVYSFLNKFIFTFTQNAFYVFNPENVTLLLWCNLYKNIFDVKIVKNFVYIWNEDLEIHAVSIDVLEDLILRTLFQRQYILCAELCINFSDYIISLIETSNKIHLISILKTKLSEIEEKDLLSTLSPILDQIQDYTDNKTSPQRIKSGIVVVDNAYFPKSPFAEETEENLPETLQILKDIRSTVTDKITESSKNIKEKFHLLETTVKNLTFDTSLESPEKHSSSDFQSTSKQNLNKLEPESHNCKEENCETTDVSLEECNLVTDQNYIINMLYKQYEYNKINKSIEIEKLKNVLNSLTPENVKDLLDTFSNFLKTEKNEDADFQSWCSLQYLKYFSRRNFLKDLEVLEADSSVFIFLKECFECLNLSNENSCQCGFPYPSASLKMPLFYEIGCELIKKNYTEDTVKKVPYMFRYILSNLRKDESLKSLLPLVIQYNNEEILDLFLTKFTYDIWDDAIKYLIKLKKNICLNCEQCFCVKQPIISWTTFSTLMIKSIGAVSTIKLLKRYSKVIPSQELTSDFYQTCIFSTALDNFQGGYRKEVVGFMKEMTANEERSNQFTGIMAKYLNKKYTEKVSHTIPKENAYQTMHLCTYCELPTNREVLEDVVQLSCDHFYHKICLDHVNNKCCTCKQID